MPRLHPHWLDQFKTNLSIGFGSNSQFGIDIGYVRSRREYLASREQKWSIGFSARLNEKTLARNFNPK